MFEKLDTEKPNPDTVNLDSMNVYQILEVMNAEDSKVPKAVSECIPQIERTVEFCIKAVKSFARVVYVGAGTSGRLAVLDSAEIIPTFGVDEGIFVPILAGGDKAFVNAVENAEDSSETGENALKQISLMPEDVVIGITASGRTPFVKGALSYAKTIGCSTCLICNVSDPNLSDSADIVISAYTGPEVLTGSTRLKAGTAQKLILNMISTATMIKTGRVFGNYMIGVKIMNEKLMDRAIRIVSGIAGISYEKAEQIIVASEKNVPVAILMALTEGERELCEKMLRTADGNIRSALEKMRQMHKHLI